MLTIILSYTLSRRIMSLKILRTIDVSTNKFSRLRIGIIATLLTEASTTTSANQLFLLEIFAHLISLVLIIAFAAISCQHIGTLETRWERELWSWKQLIYLFINISRLSSVLTFWRNSHFHPAPAHNPSPHNVSVVLGILLDHTLRIELKQCKWLMASAKIC